MYTIPACSTAASHYLFPGCLAWSPSEGREGLEGQKGPPWFSISNLLLTFAEHLLCGKYCSKCFTSIISFNPKITLGNGYCYQGRFCGLTSIPPFWGGHENMPRKLLTTGSIIA